MNGEVKMSAKANIPEKTTDLTIAYIGGGSRGWAWNLMADLAMEPELSGTVKLYDIDMEAALDNEAIGNRLAGREDAPGKWRYRAVESLAEALQGADFIVISIQPGTFAEMASDVHEPEKYGIYQPVGDTTGPGGIVRALRTVPMYVEFAEAIREHSPQAWVINYTNPMSVCTRTLYEVFPEVKAFGCCHEVFGVQYLLTEALAEMRGITGVQRREISINVTGVNHFTWIDWASYKDIDLLPVYREFASRHAEEGFERTPGAWRTSYFSSADRVKFDLCIRYGPIAAAGDRHLAEFMPPWYLKDPETVAAWKFSLTPVSWRVEHKRELVRKAKRLAAGEEEFTLQLSGEEGVRTIKALLGRGDLVTNVNLPNLGQIEGMPRGCVVETNALLGRDRISPVAAGRLPHSIQSLLLRHAIQQEDILRAALARDREKAFRAFLNDPLVAIGVGEARELFDRMLYNTRAYLPGWEI